MPFTRDQYSRTRTNSVRQAMAAALAESMREAQFQDQLGRAVRFARVYDAWPTHTDRLVVPAACVLPNPTRFSESQLTPSLLRETWEPEGQAGFGLYKVAEVEADFEVEVRAPTSAERDVVLSGMEDLWTASDSRGVELSGFQPGLTQPRYGIVCELPGYWGLCGAFWLQGSRPLDNEQSAIREHWSAICTIRGLAPAVRLGPVQPMKPIVKALFE